MNIPNTFEKPETGESISCSLCGQIILLLPNKYPDFIVEGKIQIHYQHCPAKKK